LAAKSPKRCDCFKSVGNSIVTEFAPKAFAAFNQREEVTLEDIEKVITLCLRHRLRKDPLETIDSGDKVQKVFEKIFQK
jgi:magnesium chelatase subunit I